mmetsp:Transcript_47553/g.40166  ORF Transcript_47553/g.40166 Transcript_47553/m.40166 type:complete len:845 (+) Transcript_47553:1-2535(+)
MVWRPGYYQPLADRMVWRRGAYAARGTAARTAFSTAASSPAAASPAASSPAAPPTPAIEPDVKQEQQKKTKDAAVQESRVNFISNMIKDDLQSGKRTNVLTRFPPEPNGYLHIGHAKSICLNFGVAKDFKGATNMRFDDTNPVKEDQEYVDSILSDVRWLAGSLVGRDDPWDGEVRYASSYFDDIYAVAEHLITTGKAYVDSLTAEEIREYRGTLTEAGKNSPYRERSVEENLEMFRKMKAGDYDEGSHVLRAKIDMGSANLNMRDPAMYRIRKAHHVMTGDTWKMYPMYDFAHCISDAIEGITHSLCTLEFEDHRPLYDWFVKEAQDTGLLKGTPEQTEFSRLNLQYTVLSKRKLIQLVEGKHVAGWSDPRMPTISGVRRRGYTPAAMQLFCHRIGISKADNNIDMSVLEDCAREVLEEESVRALAVLDPILLTISNWPEGKVEEFETEVHPKRPELGTRTIPFSGQVYIDREDFSESPPKGFFRLTPGGSVRLRFAYVVTCDQVLKDADGKVTEIKCSYIEATRAGTTPDGMQKVKGIVQWVSKQHALACEVRLYDRLFSTPLPGKDHEDGDFLKDLNLDSLKIITTAVVEPSLASVAAGTHVQFERIGYFYSDPQDCKPGNLVFNRVVTLRDNWAVAAAATTQVQQPTTQQQSIKGGGGGGAAAAPAGGGASVQDILRLDLRVGKIVSAEQHPDADSLYVEQIDVGDPEGPRTIVSGLAKYIPLAELPGRMCTVLCNLKPAKMRGVESGGMVLCGANEAQDTVQLLEPPPGAKVGERIVIQGYDAPDPDLVLKSKTQQKVWPAVAPDLKANAEGLATYKGSLLQTSAGPLKCASLIDCLIG